MIAALRGADSGPLRVFPPPLKQQGPQGVTFIGDSSELAGQVAASQPSGGLFDFLDAHPIASWAVPLSIAAVIGWVIGGR